MRLEGAGDLDPVVDKGLEVADVAVFAVLGQEAHRVLEGSARADEAVGQAEHLAEGAVRGGKAEVAVVDRQGLLDQVEPGLDQCVVLAVGGHRILPAFR